MIPDGGSARVKAVRSIAYLTAGEIINKVTRFVAAVILARELSLEDFGLVNVGIATAGLLFIASGLGLPETGLKEASVNPDRKEELTDRVLGGRLATAIGLGAAVAAVVAVAAPADLPVILLAITMALALAASVEWLLRGLERMAATATASAAGGLVVLLGTAIVVPLVSTAEAALAIFVAGEIAVAGFALRFARLRRLPHPRTSGLRTMLRKSWPLGLSALVVYSYYANLDTILLSAVRSPEEAGLYSAPYRLFLAFNIVGTFAAYAILPTVTRAVASGPVADARAMEAVREALLPLMGYALVVLGAIVLLGDEILSLVFGRTFRQVDDVFVLLAVAIPWYSVAFPVGYALIARDANRRFLAGAGVAGGLNLVGNAVLIPAFGVDGAAIATAVALVAGSIVWLAAHGMLSRKIAGLLSLLTSSSVAAAATLVWTASAQAIGASILAAGGLALAVSLRRMTTRSFAP